MWPSASRPVQPALRLGLVLFVLRLPHALGLLFPIFGSLALAIVLGAKRGLVGLRSWRCAARSIKTERQPTIEAPELATELLHLLLHYGKEHRNELRCIAYQSQHEALVGAQGLVEGEQNQMH